MTRTGSAFSCALLLAASLSGANVAPLKDPTRPLRPAPQAAVAPQGDRAQPSLDSVLLAPGRRVAVIDGRRMTEGDIHGGLRVVEIHADRVVVSVDGAARLVLELANSRMHKEMR